MCGSKSAGTKKGLKMNINRIGISQFQTNNIKLTNEKISVQNSNMTTLTSFTYEKSHANISFRGNIDKIFLLYPQGLRYSDGREEMPDLKSYKEQFAFVNAILSRNTGIIKDADSDTAEKITKALQDNEGFISGESLQFLNRILRIAEFDDKDAADVFSVQDLIGSIKVVKDENGQCNLKKCTIFINTLPYELSNSASIKDVIKRVEEIGMKTKL